MSAGSSSIRSGRRPTTPPPQLHAECAKGALEDAGLSSDDIDGYFCAGDAPGFGAMSMADYMGLKLQAHGLHRDRRLVLHRARRPRRRGDRGGQVLGGADHPGRPAARSARAGGGGGGGRGGRRRRRRQRGARGRLREHLGRHDPQHLRHVRHAPHARVRHHLRAAGLDQGRRLAPRAVERARHAARGGDGRGGAGLADDRRPAAPDGLLRDLRRRRRGDRGLAGGGQEPEAAAGQGDRPRRGAQGPARRQGPRPDLSPARPGPARRPGPRRASRRPTSSTPRSTTASPSPC